MKMIDVLWEQRGDPGCECFACALEQAIIKWHTDNKVPMGVEGIVENLASIIARIATVGCPIASDVEVILLAKIDSEYERLH